MFQEVSCAIGLVCFRSASRIDPNSNGRGLSPWRVLGRNLHIVRLCLCCFIAPVHTVKPFERVVHSVLEVSTGLAYRLRGDWMDRRACRLRMDR